LTTRGSTRGIEKQQELAGLALLVLEKKLTPYNRRLMVSPVIQLLDQI
jgi:hypothetical protein